MKNETRWFVAADGREAHLYSCQVTPGGKLHVNHAKSLQNSHEDDRERHRPSLLGGAERRGATTRSSAGAAPHSVSIGHEVEEDEQRFAREIKEWVNGASRQCGVSKMRVFAPPRFLGLLREHLGETADLVSGELAHLTTSDLAEHPAVREAVDREPAAQRR